MLQKRIYRSICFVSMLSLVLIMLFALPACYTLLAEQTKEKIVLEGQAIANMLEISDNPYSVIENIDADNRYLSLADENGEVVFENKKGNRQSDKFSYTKEIDGVGILFFSAEPKIMSDVFLILVIPVIFFSILIFLLVHLIASKISESIVNPITNINFNTPRENLYNELRPFVSTIKNQNAEIRKQITRLKEQKSRLGTISENMNEGLIVFDKNGTILSINKSAMKIFSAKDDRIFPETEINNLSDDSKFTEGLKEALSGEKRFFEYITEDNTYQVFCSPVYEKETVSGCVMLILDISEKQKAERIRREFSANVSHELKTPLTTVLGYSELIAGGMVKEEDIKGFASKIAHESSRLIGLIEDIIKLSKLDEQVDVEEPETINIYEIAQDVASELSMSAEKNNISINVIGEDMFIKGNPSQIYELVFNLCDNAVKYNKKDGKVFVKVAGKTMTVEDTGIGIPQKDIGRIFERFYRVDKSRSKAVSGTGLGLSIVKHIALSHNAEIDVESRQNEGTRIMVRF